LRPKRLKNIMESLSSHLQTDIAFWEGVRLARLAKDIDLSQMVSRVLDTSEGGVLVERNYDGAFVLEPKNGTWEEVKKVAAGLLDKTIAKPSPSPSPLPKGEGRMVIHLPAEKAQSTPLPAGEDVRRTGEGTPTVEIQNGTFTVGLAARTAEQLERLGFNPVSIGNASLRDVATTIVYDLTGGKKKEAFEKLKTTLRAISGEGDPSHLISQNKLDFVVILGKNAVQ